LCQLQATCLHVHLPDRLEQGGFQLQVKAQLAEQSRQALLHWLIGKQRLPQHRQHAVPGRAGHQQQRLVPEIGDRTTALVHADHGVHRQDQRRRGNRAIAFAQGTEHGQAKRGEGEGNDEKNGVGEQQFDGEGGNGKTHQRHR
jgi:hypothetical protein